MTIPVQFKTEYPVGRDPVDWVELAPKGAAFERVRSWHRVERLRPPDNLTEKDKESLYWQVILARWSVIGPAYEAWKAGHTLPETGTPLAAWSAISPEQAEVLRKMRVLTVEDVRDLDDRTLTELRFPNARRLPELAAQFLASKDVTDRDAEAAELRERLAAMEELLEAQAAAMKADAFQEQPKRRGRPPKVEAA